ncbi:MAG: carboxypeptidase-like regulatory domain-containing protein [Phycisphaerales bacterium]|nr:carboxypeptidase-like regulatory domain-containing protein [Phycisphaerales bacterium]
MNRQSVVTLAGAGLLLMCSPLVVAQQVGSIRGMVYDKDFEAPLPLAQITVAETGAKVEGTEQGNYVIENLPPAPIR